MADIIFSVIIPTFNRAELIEKTLQSVLKQTFDGFEIIVVDNCSTDNTREVLDEFIGSGVIRFIQHDKNYERARSRNTGLLHARGAFATFLDSDDLMYEQNLRDAYDFICKHPHIKIFHNLYELIDQTGRVLYRYPKPWSKNPLKNISEGNFLSCIGVFVHRDLFSAIRFDEDPDLTGSEDWEYWIRILAHDANLGTIPKINSGIVHHQGRTVTGLDVERVLRQKSHVLQKIRKDPFLMRHYGPYLRLMESNAYIYAAIVACNGKLGLTGLKLLAMALKADFTRYFAIRFQKVFLRCLIRL